MNAEIKTRIEKINKGEVPEGYKKTRVGIIPEDWEVKRLEEIANILRGASPRPISSPKWFDDNSNIGWVRISDVSRSNKILIKTEQYLSNKGIEKSRLVKKDNIIMSICATVGKPIYTGFDICIHDGFVVFDELNIDKEFFYYMLLNKEKSWYRYGQTGSQMNLNTSIVGKERINIPLEIKEQQKIAQILSTWDKAIELKEKLIEEKKEQKKGLMQKLLTGEVRLPGFDGEWEEVRLGEVSECLDNKRKPLNSSEREQMKGNIPYYGANGIVDYINDYLFDEKLILLAEDGGYFDEFLTRPIAIKIEGKSWVNNHAHVLRAKNMNFDFLFYSLVHKDIRKYINGTTRSKLTRGEMVNVKLIIPKSLQEQKAIAQILSTADKEIDLLIQELEQLKLQKKGLMQLLLTGIIRVKS